MSLETYTIDLPEGAPQAKIINVVNQVTGSRILGIIDEKGEEGPVTLQLTEPNTSIETVHSLIRHCSHNAKPRLRIFS